MANVDLKVTTKEFDAAMREYMKVTKRTEVEALNQHAYYACRNAANMTKAATKEEIKKDLEQDSKKYPGVPLAAILVNVDRKKRKLKGIFGEKMISAVEKFIRKNQAHRNFLRSGWIPAIKRLEMVIPKKGGASIPPGTKKKGRVYGGATPAKENLSWNFVTRIWNSSTSNSKTQEKAAKYIEAGIDAGIKTEINSMIDYINKKNSRNISSIWG